MSEQVGFPVASWPPGGARACHGKFSSLVYLLFPGTRETLRRGGFLESFEVISGQFSVNFPIEISGTNPRKSLLKTI